MYTHQVRIIIETSIIAELLEDPNAFIKVSEILSPQNFREEKYQKIFKACSDIYPDEIISYLSVAARSGLHIKDVVVEHVFNNNLSPNIQYNAYILLQLSIRDQYQKLTKKLRDENENEAKKEDLLTLYTSANNEEYDVIASIDDIVSYFKENPLFAHELKEIESFRDNIVKKVDKIKSGLHVKNLFHALDNLYHFDYQKQGLLSALSKITRHVMANPVSPELANKIQALSITL